MVQVHPVLFLTAAIAARQAHGLSVNSLSVSSYSQQWTLAEVKCKYGPTLLAYSSVCLSLS